ncbi:hypothetical protein ACOL20_04010 [Aliarcobacter butzleri]
MKDGKFTHKDILVLLLYTDNATPIIGKTRIQKIVYLYEEELHKQIGWDKKVVTKESSLFGFYPHYFGPFSDNLPIYLDELIAFNIIEQEIIKNNSSPNKPVTKYTITNLGINYVESKLLKYIDSIKIDLLSEFKIKYNNMIRDDLLHYVYNKYELMTVKSIIKEQYVEGI